MAQDTKPSTPLMAILILSKVILQANSDIKTTASKRDTYWLYMVLQLLCRKVSGISTSQLLSNWGRNNLELVLPRCSLGAHKSLSFVRSACMLVCTVSNMTSILPLPLYWMRNSKRFSEEMTTHAYSIDPLPYYYSFLPVRLKLLICEKYHKEQRVGKPELSRYLLSYRYQE